ncbi:hypothetical protein GCM10009555_008840 [Acrocarpospora macrocephala]|uniref:DUF1918 domain-containing protein n=1 Tax=Acrocarpospora macrocephala TaxID=150177 RepID=A0A5M3X118_9ACTN|nr:DUF1918 domain-containing protein [Acrocarpospora macrocephala]GES14834.1 hypothetical protein Amac_084310 [Acrocarpospora macrocephala]
MHAAIGDKLIVEGTYHGEHQKIGIVTEVRHADGTPPYVVRWTDSNEETLVFPGPDARVVAKES